MKYKLIGVVLILLGVFVFAFVLYRNSEKRKVPIIFSPKLMLGALWDTYKREYWEKETGRTVDRQRNGITTSEGQSYTMLRAVWQDDKEVFDKTWGWTKDNLQQEESGLFSWLYGQKPDGSYGILTDQGGSNSASDADTDIALALIFASSRWQDPQYLAEAKAIIQEIWNQEVITINNVPYLAANNVEQHNPDRILINPSYLAPYAYRLFAIIDDQHNWSAVVQGSYGLLAKISDSALDKSQSSGLPPDWVAIDRKTGQLSTPNTDGLTTNFGFDALRVPFRVAVDWEWNKDERAKELLSRYHYLDQEWEKNKAIFATYTHDGQAVTRSEVPAMYGGTIGYFLVSQPKTEAEDIYKAKLESLYSPDFQDWKERLGYYDDNWSWFGVALYHGQLPNLFRLPAG